MEITTLQVIQWFRDKAREYDRKADELERDFNIAPSATQWAGDAAGSVATVADIDRIVAFVSMKGSARMGEISTALKLSYGTVQLVLGARPDLFTKGEQGWYKLARNPDWPVHS